MYVKEVHYGALFSKPQSGDVSITSLTTTGVGQGDKKRGKGLHLSVYQSKGKKQRTHRGPPSRWLPFCSLRVFERLECASYKSREIHQSGRSPGESPRVDHLVQDWPSKKTA